jgi:hypothetical protein
VIPNVGLPLVLLAMLVGLPRVGIDKVSRVTAATCLATMAAQLLVDGSALARHAVSRYTRKGIARAVLSVIAGLFSFAMVGAGWRVG